MPYITPKTDWTPADGVADTDFNRIEGNIEVLKTTTDAHTITINDLVTSYLRTRLGGIG